MTYLFWIGLILILIGIGFLSVFIFKVLNLQRSSQNNLTKNFKLNEELAKLIPLNLVSISLAMLGLLLVIVSLLLS